MSLRPGAIALTVVVFSLASAVRPARAQPAAPAPDDSWPCKPGCRLVESDELRVTDADGVIGLGRLRSFDATTVRLVLPDGGELTMERERVRRIERRGDPLGNGIVIGALFGLFSIGMSEALAGKPTVADYIGGAAVWGAVGAFVDSRRKGWTRVYEAAEKGARASGGRNTFWVAPARQGVRIGFSRTF